MAPGEVWVEFNEPVDAAATSLVLVTFNGSAIAHSETHAGPQGRFSIDVQEPLLPDAYLVRFRTISRIDGHESTGVWVFAVGNGTLPADVPDTDQAFPWASATAKGLALAGLATIAAAVVSSMVLRAEDPGAARRHYRYAVIGSLLYAAGTFGQILLLPADGSAALLRLLRETEAGTWLGVRFLLALGLGATLLWLGAQRAFTKKRLVGTALVSLCLAHGLTSHAAARLPAYWLGGLLDATHALAVVLWTGGLLAFFQALRRVPRVGDGPAPEAVTMSRRFSRLAMACVALLGLSGIGLIYAIYKSLPAAQASITASAYGLLLANKILLAGIMIALGGLNHVLFVRRFASGRPTPPIATLSANVRREVANGAIILALAAVLTNLSPGL